MNLLIIEDEEAAYKRLYKMVKEELPDAMIYPQLVSIQATVEWFAANSFPDLLFADVHLADGDSFEIFKQVQVTCPIIFTTAYDQYALEAFKVNSIDYLLKPIKKEDVRRAIDKFTALKGEKTSKVDLQKLLDTLHSRNTDYKQRFVVKYGEHIKTIEIADVAYFYTENKANFLVTRDNKRYVVDFNLDEIETLVDPKKFFRINRQFIIAFSAIAEMFSYSKSRVLIKLDPPTKLETIVSAERSASFKAWLDA